MPDVLTPHTALVYVMVTMSAVDTEMTNAELGKIGDLTRYLPIFDGFPRERLPGIARDCARLLQEEDGLALVLDVVAESVPAKLYDTVYALAVEVAAADLAVKQEELRFLQMLRDRLDLDKLTVAAIERGARARYRTL